MGRIIQQAIGLLTGGAEDAGDAQDPSRTIASERASNGAIVAGLFPTTHPGQTIRLRIMTGIVTRIVSNALRPFLRQFRILHLPFPTNAFLLRPCGYSRGPLSAGV